MSEKEKEELASVPRPVDALVRKFMVRGICLVPCEVEMLVDAASEKDAIAKAMKSNWKQSVDGNSIDAGAAYDWQPCATEVDSANAGIERPVVPQKGL